MNRAESLLLSGQKVSERASKYAERVAKSLELKLITSLEEEIEEKNDKILDLENFSLETDLNKGIKPLTKEEVEANFKTIIELTFERDLLEAKLNSYKKAYDYYFKTEVKDKKK